MDETAVQRIWRREAHLLGEVGAIFNATSLPDIEVRLPRHIAERAVEAWRREDGDGPFDPETYEQSVQRARAATLALIGLAITSVGRWERDEVVVRLHPALVGEATLAAGALPQADGTTEGPVGG
jgi:hypothetical protein